MIPAHMDEIGFMVHVITDDGFIKFIPLVDGGTKSSWDSEYRYAPARIGQRRDWFQAATHIKGRRQE